MYDDLVMRLRSVKDSWQTEEENWMLEAADAIEELQGKYYLMKKTAEWLVEKVPKWIPVTERLPETDDDVVAAFKNSKDGEWWYRIDNFVDGAFCYNAAFGRNITHWMPLPEPPKEE